MGLGVIPRAACGRQQVQPCELQERAETLVDSSASVSWKWILVESSWLNWVNWVSIANPATLLQA